MSPVAITVLIISGIIILFVIGYINHLLENSKLEKARLRADLTERMRRNRVIADSLPGQLLSPALKLLLSRFELNAAERLQNLDKHDDKVRSRIAQLREALALGDKIGIDNPKQKIASENAAKDVRQQLENLHGQITRAVQDGQLSAAEGKHWIAEIRQMLGQLYFELFNNIGQQAMQQQQPGQARLAYERGVQFLRKQPANPRNKAQLEQLEQLLAQANAMVLEHASPAQSEPSELTEGLSTIEEDWKKKNIYD